MIMMSSEVYEKLGLSAEEGQIYTIITSKLVRTKEEIELLAEKIVPQVEDLLKSLEEKKFVRVIPGKVPQYRAIAPPIAISPKIDQQVETINSEYYNEINSQWEQGQTALQSIINQIQEGGEQLTHFKEELNSTIDSFIKRINKNIESDEIKIQGKINKANKTNTDTLKKYDLSLNKTLQSTKDKNLKNLGVKVKDIQSDFKKELDKLIKDTALEQTQAITDDFEKWITQHIENIEVAVPLAQSQREEQITSSNEQVNQLSDNIQKMTLEFSRKLPIELEEYTAQHTDSFNIFDRTIKAELNKLKGHFLEIKNVVNEKLSKRVSLGKGGYEDIGKLAESALQETDESSKQIDKQIEEIIKNFDTTNSSLNETINSSLNNQNIEFQRLLDIIKNDLSGTINKSSDLLLSNLNSVLQNIQESQQQQKNTLLNQINQLSSVIVKKNEDLFKNVNQTLSGFLKDLEKELQTVANQFDEDTSTRLTDVSETITAAGNSYYELIKDSLSSVLASVETEAGKVTTALEKTNTNLVEKINKKTKEVHNSISDNFEGIIRSIPDKISKNLAESREILNLLGEINNLAVEIPVASVENTYLQIESLEGITKILEAILTRTKSTIQIIVPNISILPVDTIKKITRRRIQVLTPDDSHKVILKLKKLDNLQLKCYKDLGHIYAIARDGTEEVVIGSGKGEKIPLISTTDEDLASMLKEIIQDYWPRGKTV